MDKVSIENQIYPYLPYAMKIQIDKINNLDWNTVTEIRMTAAKPIIFEIKGRRYFINNGVLTNNPSNAFCANESILLKTLELLTKSSIYAYNCYINEGFITLPGGHRAGIIGTCVIEKNCIVSVRDISAVNLRIAHAVQGVSDLIFKDIFDGKRISNTLIISPPGCGKTTLLRDIALNLSNPIITKQIFKCGIVDERFEIASSCKGISTLDTGYTSFVISGCPKPLAIPILVRSMAPDVIITDELGCPEDMEAVQYAVGSGCSIVATAHGKDEICNEVSMYLKDKIFDKIIILSYEKGPGTIHKVMEGK